MTQEEIIEMARKAGLDWHTGWTLDDEEPNRFETLVNLATDKEREACVKIVQTHLAANDHLRTKDSLASVLDYIKFIR